MSIFKFDDITSNAHFAGFLNGHLAVITLYWDKYYYKAAFVSTFLGSHTLNDGKWLHVFILSLVTLSHHCVSFS